MKVGIDARFIGPQGTGLGKYTEKLIENLAQIDHQNKYFIFLRQKNWDYLRLSRNFTKVLADIPWYSLAEQTKLAGIFQKQNLDLLHVPHFNVPLLYQGKYVITIHDLIHHQFSQEATTTRNPLIFKIKRLGYKVVISWAVKRAQKIIVPSSYVKEQVEETFKVSPNKITVTYEAAEEEYFGKNKPGLANLQTGFEGYLVYVGNAYPHKNLNALLDALTLVLSNETIDHRKESTNTMNYDLRTLNLIIVSPRDVFTQRLKSEIKKRHLEDHVKLAGYLEAKGLVKLFHEASTYVFPSLAEGFGIPGLNAMAAGLPVTCSAIPTLKEVYGQAALYFDPHDEGDIAEKIAKAVRDNTLRERLINSGYKQAAKYSWRRLAEQTLGIYQSA